MIRPHYILTLAALLPVACKPTQRTALVPKLPQQQQQTAPAETTPAAETEKPAPAPRVVPSEAIVGVNAVIQNFNPVQPWEKEEAKRVSALGVYLGNGRVLTASNVADAATYTEFSLPDASRTATARVLRKDAELGLALLVLEHPEERDFFATRTPLLLGDPLSLGDQAEVAGLVRGLTPVNIPLEAAAVENGSVPRLSLRLAAPLPDGHAMGAPIVKGGRLVGLSTGYHDMQLTSINAEQLARFLSQKSDDGLPLLGVQFSAMDDPAFCAYLKADTGLYIGKVLPGSAAEQAGLQVGDVLTKVEDMPIDNRGRCRHPLYGLFSASALMKTLKPLGETLSATVVRNGETVDVSIPLNRDAADNALFGTDKPGVQPRYAIWGGLLFQPLTETYLNAVRSRNNGNLPMEIQRLTETEKEVRERGYNEPVALTMVIPTPATMGYDNCRFCMVEAVNGKPARDFTEFLRLLDEPTPDGLVHFTLNKAPFNIYLDRAAAEAANEQIRARSIPKLRAE